MRRLLAVVLWSVIAAAFIGPGTVTTSGAAGSPSSFSTIPIEPRPAWRTKGGGGRPWTTLEPPSKKHVERADSL